MDVNKHLLKLLKDLDSPDFKFSEKDEDYDCLNPNWLFLDFLDFVNNTNKMENKENEIKIIRIIEQMIKFKKFRGFLHTDIFWDVFTMGSPTNNLFTRNLISKRLKTELDEFTDYWNQKLRIEEELMNLENNEQDKKEGRSL